VVVGAAGTDLAELVLEAARVVALQERDGMRETCALLFEARA
jgi:hypothetical protein